MLLSCLLTVIILSFFSLSVSFFPFSASPLLLGITTFDLRYVDSAFTLQQSKEGKQRLELSTS